jgi:hypothetical protein
VLFRGIIKANNTRRDRVSLAIQLDPVEQRGIVEDEKEAAKYLQDYFEPARFRVEWGPPDDFIKRLYQQWDEFRRES